MFVTQVTSTDIWKSLLWISIIYEWKGTIINIKISIVCIIIYHNIPAWVRPGSQLLNMNTSPSQTFLRLPAIDNFGRAGVKDPNRLPSLPAPAPAPPFIQSPSKKPVRYLPLLKTLPGRTRGKMHASYNAMLCFKCTMPCFPLLCSCYEFALVYCAMQPLSMLCLICCSYAWFSFRGWSTTYLICPPPLLIAKHVRKSKPWFRQLN